MLLYVTLGSNDIARSKVFYDAVMATLGLVCHFSSDDEIGYRSPDDVSPPSECRLWVLKPILKLPATWGNGTTIALSAGSRAHVDAFYSAAMASGGTDEGTPGLRPFHENFYACFVRDPDGNKLSAVCEKAV
jgi:catechol 2,3-dioxygenase-like lactoylglutathione lyase family enzyme